MWVKNRLAENPPRIGIQENSIKKAVFTSCETASILLKTEILFSDYFHGLP